MTGRAFETTGTVDAGRRIVLDEPLPEGGPSRVRVIILPADAEYDEKLWMAAARSNPAFEFLSDPAEDIYTVADGKPFGDQR